ncbi:MAG: hypothetical protein QOG64_2492 [Acidimicrobiaceae bacterium]|nr:hypothetical protein [Acidimicrobiaceae bacterium]
MARSSAARAVAGYLRKYPLAPRYRAGQRLALSTEDGVPISATALEGPVTAPATVVLVHGFVNSSRTPKIHAFAHRLAQRVHVVVPDLRGHGRSGGMCTMGLREPLDVEAAVAAARDLHPDVPVITMGTSLGGAAVLLHAGTVGGVAGVVPVSAPGWWGAFDSDGSQRIQRWIGGRVGRLVLANLLKTRIATTCDPVPDASTTVAEIAPAFTLIVHDPDDWYFGAEHARRLHEWARAPKALWWYPGAGHGTDLLTPAFADRLLAEFEARLGAAR